MTTRPIRRFRTLCGLLALLLLPAGALAASDFRIDTDVSERGSYEVWASETIDARAADLVPVLTAAKCMEGCPYRVDDVAVDEVLDQSVAEDGTMRTVSWTSIDSLLDASYFTVSIRRTDAGSTTIRFFTADEATIGRWASDARRHDPFFYRQEGTWTLTEAFDGDGVFLHTRVELEMSMRSDRFLVNLLPARVTKGSVAHMTTLFGFLRDAARPRLEADGGPGAGR